MMKVILPASSIPESSTVSKVNGSTQFVLKRNISYYENANLTKVVAKEGTVFLHSMSGTIDAYPQTTEFVWHVDESTLIDYLQIGE